MKTQHIICLGGGVEAMPIILQVAQHYTPIILDQNPKSPGALWAKANPKKAEYWNANPYSVVSCRQHAQRAMRWKRERGKEYKIVGVLCCATDSPDSQVVLANEFYLKNIGEMGAKLSKDKWFQLEWLVQHNVPVPDSKLVSISDSDFSGYDLIKPRISRGARGVQRLIEGKYRQQLIEAIANSDSGYKQAILQQYISGLQLSTESVIANGQIVFTAIALRNYDTPYAPYIIEDGSDCPFHLSVDRRSELESLVLRASLSMGWDNCTVKGDIVLGENGFTVIELAPRLSGGLFCSHIIPLAYGYDIVDAAIGLAVRYEPYPYEPKPMRSVCQRFVFPKPEWIGKRLTRVPIRNPELWDNNALIHATTYKSVGDKLDPVTYHGARLAQVIAAASTPTDATRRADEMVEELEGEFYVE